MKRTCGITLGVLLTGIAAGLPVQAAESSRDGQPKPPLEQASESVNKNLQKHPDNRGLQNASQRLSANQKKIAAHRAQQDARKQQHPSAEAPTHAGRSARGRTRF